MNIFMKLAAAAVITFTAAVGFAGESVSAYELQRHTQQQIRERFEQLDIDIHDVTEYSQAYTDSSPYKIGSPSDEARQQALDALNFVRYVAGLPDDVELEDDLNYKAQSGSLVLYLNQAISHTPPKPDGLPQSIYDGGYEACGESNIGLNYYNMANSVISGYINDSDYFNMPRLGHRRWALNPDMKKTGFGIVGNATAMYAMDTSRSDKFTGDYICWPCYNTPYELVTDTKYGYAYSVCLGDSYDYPDMEKVTVNVSSKKLGKSWRLSKNSYIEDVAPDTDLTTYFNVEKSSYGLKKCIIFNVGKLPHDDTVTVEVRGITKKGVESPISYTVNYFDLFEDEPYSFHQDSYELLLGDELQIHTSHSPLENGDVNFFYSGDKPSEYAGAVYIASSVYLKGLKEGKFKLYIGSDDNAPCAEVTVTHKHTPSAWTTVTEPTDEESGTDHRVCTQCGAELERRATAAGDISKAQVVFARDSFAVGTTAASPEYKVYLGEVQLLEGVDFSSTISGNLTPGTGRLKLTGKGRLTGSLTKEFTVVSKYDLSQCDLTFSADRCIYDGSAKRPAVTLSYLGEELTQGSDYTLSYSGNVDIGNATAIAVGKGRFSGIKTGSFAITEPDAARLTLTPKSGTTLAGAAVSCTALTTAKTAAVSVTSGNAQLDLCEDWYDITITRKGMTPIKLSVYVKGNVNVTVSPALLGDVDNSGRVDIKDAMRAIMLVNGRLAGSVEERTRADVDTNGKLNVSDLIRLIACVKGRITL